MTKRTSDAPSELARNQLTLHHIAADLESGALSERNRAVLVKMLRRIARGEDANEVFGVKRKRGERNAVETANADLKLRSALSLVATLTQPEPDGYGMKPEDAVAQVAKPVADGGLGYSYETLLHHWSNNPHLHSPRFNPSPILLPTKR